MAPGERALGGIAIAARLGAQLVLRGRTPSLCSGEVRGGCEGGPMAKMTLREFNERG